ncbi:MAG: LysM peptidoglycan-binding domain-containing protein [Planctomycetes bacterium]|nr:LysM peptidoglycan-binding domain-containing protein [Planctomycetota bacterium]MBU4399528.1 LysM peptidoglycan-binding domain-containing protein [Planctomycetota bacterium]MCG2684962.1 LysM peptidoglycan-binding domain-containing protein [Planctomycetales bacterium]
MNDKEKTGESVRLGKEAKVGVTVILALLLVFAAVVAVRLTGSSSDGGLAAAADQNPGKAKRPDEDRDEKHFSKAAKPKSHGGNPPTVVLAKSDTGRPPKPIDNDLDKWKPASDKGKAKPVEGNGPVLISPPPLPPKPQSGNRYERNPSDPTSGWEFNDSPRGHGPADASRTMPDENTRRRPGRGEIPPDRAETSGYTSVGAPPPPESSHPDRSYADATDQPTQAAPISRNGASEYPRLSPRSMYDNNGPRRGGAPPPLRADGKYEVQPLDSFWTISERLYGTGAYFKALAEHNRDKVDDEERLQPGDLVLTPTVEQLEKSYPDLCPKPSRRETLRERASTVGTHRQYRSGRTYTVAEGDTLFDIARYELGKASRWVEVYELNRDVLGKDFNYITPGTKLVLPDSGRPDVLAEPPSSGYRR